MSTIVSEGEFYGFTISNPPVFSNPYIILHTTNDRIIRDHSIPLLFSICARWKHGEVFERNQVYELPYMQKFNETTRMIYATAVINWAVKLQRKYKEIVLGIEIPDRRNKFIYIRTRATTLFELIEKHAETTGALQLQEKEKEQLRLNKFEAKENPLEEYGIGGPGGLGLDTEPEPSNVKYEPNKPLKVSTQDLKGTSLTDIAEVELDGEPTKIDK